MVFYKLYAFGFIWKFKMATFTETIGSKVSTIVSSVFVSGTVIFQPILMIFYVHYKILFLWYANQFSMELFMI
jgi:hypothetical protein